MQIEITHAFDAIQRFVHSYILYEDAITSLEIQNTTPKIDNPELNHTTPT